MLRSLFSRKSSKKETRLRHVLYLGSLVEQQAEAFYRHLAKTEYAMNAEKKMVIFYLDFKKEFVSEWKKTKLWKMIEEEESHVKKLSNMLSSLHERKLLAE